MENDETSIRDEPERLEPGSPQLNGLPLETFGPRDMVHTPPEFAVTEADLNLVGGRESVSGSSLWKDAWRRLLKNKLAVFGMVIVILITVACLIGPSVVKATTGFTPDLIPSGNAKLLKSFPPFTAPDGSFSWTHPMGTDNQGRDLLARVLQGGQISLMVGIISALVSLFIGISYGAIAGYLGGRVDNVMMRLVDVLYSLPYIIIVIVLLSMFRSQTARGQVVLLFIALGSVSWLTMARIVRGQVLSLKNQEFVLAARATGVSTLLRSGDSIYLNAADAQLGRGELIKDTARVLARMIHGAVIRTYAQRDLEEFAEFSGVPTVNALTDDEHPCQILGDIFTIEEKRERIDNKIVAFVGDGAANTAQSWLFAAGKLDFELRIASPKRYQPKAKLLKRAGGRVICTEDLQQAARGADVLYTDIWVSMGKEGDEARREAELGPYWVNESLVKLAKPDALVMHCLPAHRGQEIEEKTFEAHAQTIFDQAENRLHVQKAILAELARGKGSD